ncbi:unnamed protein product [Phytophthora fragariaefolia]|uniref:Unnamed protein product n=1 Tax=Phytophthora fragariaefolia TaxID=1490495 RepID=A0A9W6TPT6_9STRA|nr:unnamed protein product [Phytophthora fragariaefolia]
MGLHGSVDKKLAVVAHHKQCKEIRKTIEHYFPNLSSRSYDSKRTTILRWARESKRHGAATAEGNGTHKKVRSVGTATVLSAENEAYLAQCVNELREEGIPVSTRMLKDKALDVAEEAELPSFKASDKWVIGFKNRHRFSFRFPTRQSQISPADVNVIAADFATKVEATVRELGVIRVYNADQTAVFFKYVAKKTLSKRGQKTVWVKSSGASKERASVMLFGDSNGNKYMSFVVFKTKPTNDKAIREYNDQQMRGFGYRI